MSALDDALKRTEGKATEYKKSLEGPKPPPMSETETITREAPKSITVPAAVLHGAAEMGNPGEILPNLAGLAAKLTDLVPVGKSAVSSRDPEKDKVAKAYRQKAIDALPRVTIPEMAAGLESLNPFSPLSMKDQYKESLNEKLGYERGLPPTPRAAGGLAAAVVSGNDLLKLLGRGLVKAAVTIKPGLIEAGEYYTANTLNKLGFSRKAADIAAKNADVMPTYKGPLGKPKVDEAFVFDRGQDIGKAVWAYEDELRKNYQTAMDGVLTAIDPRTSKPYAQTHIELMDVAKLAHKQMMERSEIGQTSSYAKFLQKTLNDFRNIKYRTFAEAQKVKKDLGMKFARRNGPESAIDLNDRDIIDARNLQKKLAESIDNSIVDVDGNSLTKPINDQYAAGMKDVRRMDELLGDQNANKEFKNIQNSLYKSVDVKGTSEARALDEFGAKSPPAKLATESAQKALVADQLRGGMGPGASVNAQGVRGYASLGMLKQFPKDFQMWLLGKMKTAEKSSLFGTLFPKQEAMPPWQKFIRGALTGVRYAPTGGLINKYTRERFKEEK